MLRFYLQSFFVVQKVEMLLQSWCNWQPRTVDSPITAIHATASLTQKPNKRLQFCWGEVPKLGGGFPRGTKWRKVECHRNYSLALWVGGCPGVCITATFFFFPLKKKKKKSYQIHVSSPTNTEQFFFLQVIGVLLIIFSFIICFSLPLFTFPAFFLFCTRKKFTLRHLERHMYSLPNCCKWKQQQ